jgi:hypothetical protein
LPLHGRSEDSKEKENRKRNAHKTRMVCGKRRPDFHLKLVFVANVRGKGILSFSSEFCANAKSSPILCNNGARADLASSKAFATRGRKAKMALALQVVSSHLLGVLDIESALSVQPALVNRLLPHAAGEGEALKRPNLPRLFLLDGCSLTLELGPLSGRLRANSPGSKFLALLAPDRSSDPRVAC